MMSYVMDMTTTQTTAPKTIARNATRKIADLKARLGTCRSYSLDRNFEAHEVSPEWGWTQHARGFGKLTDNGDGTATLHFHGNHWLEYSA